MDNFVEEFQNSYDNYTIIDKIGNDTWQIKLDSYGKLCVLKRIDNPDIYTKLKSLNIAGIPTVLNIFEKDGDHYIAEEYINGRTLDDVLASVGRLSPHEVRSIVITLCRILNAIHSVGIIHRDIKPSNIIITCNNELYLIDFGIAREQNADAVSDTRHLGTEFYASPEQYGFAQTDNRSDIYSVGKLMLVLLTGKESTSDINALPYKRIILKCTQIDSSKRYSSDNALIAAFYINGAMLPALSAVLIVAVAAALLCIRSYTKTDTVTAPATEPTTELTTELISSVTYKEQTTEDSTLEQTTELEVTTTATTQPNQGSTPVVPRADTSSPKAQAEQSAEVTTTHSQVGRDAQSYATGALMYDGASYFGHIYIDDNLVLSTPYMELYSQEPKQTDTVKFSDSITADVYSDLGKIEQNTQQ